MLVVIAFGCAEQPPAGGNMPEPTTQIEEPLVAVTSVLEESEVHASALLLYQIGAPVTDGVVEPEWTPLVYVMIDDQSWPLSRLMVAAEDEDLCVSGSIPALSIRGDREVGDALTLTVGADPILLRRTRQQGQYIYQYDPDDLHLQIGQVTGSELVLEGFPTGVVLPPPLELEAGFPFLAQGLETGEVDLTWTPAEDPRSGLFVDFRVWDLQGVPSILSCALRDDGRARLSPGDIPAEIGQIDLVLGGAPTRVVEHPQFGTILVRTLRQLSFREGPLWEAR